MREVVIAEAVRSPIGKRSGSLSHTHPIDLLGQVQRAAVDRAGVAGTDIGQVVGGCVDQVGVHAGNITRNAWLAAGLPMEVACTTLDSACGSSQQALSIAVSLVGSGAEDVVLACGVANMSMVPIGAASADGAQAGHGKALNRTYLGRYEFATQHEGAERIATKYGVTRRDADRFALESQRRAALAVGEGRFADQIVAIDATQVDTEGSRLPAPAPFSADEAWRTTTIEGLEALAPVARPDGVHTAGSSSQIADGAAAVLVMSADAAAARGVRGRASVVASCLVGCDPVLGLEGPIPATRRILEQTGLEIGDLDVIEINEAFASVVVAWAKETDADMDRVNPNGGAIALGHPLGATGCMLVAKALHELERAETEHALVTMCCGGGLGTGTLLRRSA